MCRERPWSSRPGLRRFRRTRCSPALTSSVICWSAVPTAMRYSRTRTSRPPNWLRIRTARRSIPIPTVCSTGAAGLTAPRRPWLPMRRRTPFGWSLLTSKTLMRTAFRPTKSPSSRPGRPRRMTKQHRVHPHLPGNRPGRQYLRRRAWIPCAGTGNRQQILRRRSSAATMDRIHGDHRAGSRSGRLNSLCVATVRCRRPPSGPPAAESAALTEPPAAPGSVVKVNTEDGTFQSQDVPFPAGVAVDSQGSVSCGLQHLRCRRQVASEQGPALPAGQVWKIKFPRGHDGAQLLPVFGGLPLADTGGKWIPLRLPTPSTSRPAEQP